MSSTPPPLPPPPIPVNHAVNPASSSRGGLPRLLFFGLLSGSICFLILNAVAGVLRLRAHAGTSVVSDAWYAMAFGYVCGGIIGPIVIAGIVAGFAKRNKSDAFVICLFVVTALPAFNQISRAVQSLNSSLLPAPRSNAPRVFRNDFPPFSIELPKRFVDYRIATTSPGVLRTFVLKEGTGGQPRATLYIKNLGGSFSPNITLNRQKLRETMSRVWS